MPSLLLINTIRELPITLEDIRKAAETDGFIQQIKRQVRFNERNEKGSKVSPFSICDQTLMYPDRVVIPHSYKKKILKEFHTGYPDMSFMKFYEDSCLLTMHGA